MRIANTIERLEQKSEQQLFGYVLNIFIPEVRDEDGKRNIDLEDFVTVDELQLDNTWLTRFYQDIIDGNIDTRSPNFWERWDYYSEQIPLSEQPPLFHQAKEKLQPIKGGLRKSATSRKRQLMQQRLHDWYERAESEKDLSSIPQQVLQAWQEEAMIEAVYNALLLEKSATNRMIDVDAMPREAILCYLWENKQFDHYTQADYDEVQRIYDTFNLTKQLASERRMLTNDDVLKLAHQLMGKGFRTSKKFIGRGNLVLTHPLPTKKAAAIMARLIDTYNQEKETYPILKAIARFYASLIDSYLFDQYNDTMLTAIINLELQKYGYPFIAIRRRDIFLIESLNGRYHLYDPKPQTYEELMYGYVGNELLSIKYYFEEHQNSNPLDLPTAKAIQVPVTQITSEHLKWWNSLPELWKKIFCVAIYHPEKNDVVLTKNNFELVGDDDSDDEGLFTFHYNNPTLQDPDDLLKIFELKSIIFDREVNPALDSVVTFIPSLRYFSQLEVISLNYNYLEDISGLQGITTLKHLSLFECFTLKDYQPIASLTGLQTLNLAFCGLTDISFVRPLTRLKELNANANHISDISPCSQLTELIELDLGGNPIQDILPLTHLTQLKTLEIGIEDPEDGEVFDYDHLQILKERLPRTAIEVWWNTFTPMSDKQIMQKIAFSGIQSLQDLDEEKFFELVETYEKSDDVYLKQLADLCVNEYCKKTLYYLHDCEVNAQVDIVKKLNILFRNRVEARRIIDTINQHAKNHDLLTQIEHEENYATQFQQFFWSLAEMGLELVVRKK